MEKNFLLGVGITNETEEGVLKYIITGLEKRGDPYYVVTPNPEILVYANKHSSFKSILNGARLACPDGIGVIWGGRVVGQNFKERVTGTDLVKNLCKQCAEKPITVGFLGGRSKIAEKAAECLVRENPGLKVVFADSEWPEQQTTDYGLPTTAKHSAVDSRLKTIDILFVAFGFPKQEEWMASHVGKIPVKVMIGIGGAFDYISGTVLRAPKVFRVLGLEWLVRLIIQPWRLKRQISLVTFIQLVLKERFTNKVSTSVL